MASLSARLRSSAPTRPPCQALVWCAHRRPCPALALASTQLRSKTTKPSDNRAAQSKGYLKKSSGPPTTARGATDAKTDRFEVLRQMLYEAGPETQDAARLGKLRNLLPDPVIHETIHRAWQLRQRHRRDQVNARLERQYQALDNALEELRLADRRLYLRTIKDEHGSFYKLQNIAQPSSGDLNINSTGKLVGLFPRQMRIPTELPPEKGKIWDHEWKNPIDPLVA